MDDGIKYQWGDTYIEADQITEIGGKYWRDNNDGTITEFHPKELEFACTLNAIEAILGITNYSTKDFAIILEDEKDAIRVVEECNSLFYTRRGISAKRDGNKVQIYLPEETDQVTYTPATGNQQ